MPSIQPSPSALSGFLAVISRSGSQQSQESLLSSSSFLLVFSSPVIWASLTSPFSSSTTNATNTACICSSNTSSCSKFSAFTRCSCSTNPPFFPENEEEIEGFPNDDNYDGIAFDEAELIRYLSVKA